MVKVTGDVTTQAIVDVYEFTLEQLVSISKSGLEVFKSGIHAGAANVPLSLLSLQGFMDLLHGGAYKGSASQGNALLNLPYYNPAVQAQVNFMQDPTVQFLRFITHNVTSPVDITPSGYTIAVNQQGTGASVTSIQHNTPTWVAVPPGAKPEQVEMILNSNAPHVLPKLLSDQAYYVSKEWISLFFDTALLTGITTNIRSLVQTGTEAVSDLLGAATLGKGQTAGPLNAKLNALLAGAGSAAEPLS